MFAKQCQVLLLLVMLVMSGSAQDCQRQCSPGFQCVEREWCFYRSPCRTFQFCVPEPTTISPRRQQLLDNLRGQAGRCPIFFRSACTNQRTK